jgi:hypothetical protein
MSKWTTAVGRSPLSGARRYQVQHRAAEHGHAPDDALELKMFEDYPFFINVRFAGDLQCSTDMTRNRGES